MHKQTGSPESGNPESGEAGTGTPRVPRGVEVITALPFHVEEREHHPPDDPSGLNEEMGGGAAPQV